MNDRVVIVAGALAAIVITAVVVVFLGSPPNKDVTPVITLIIGVPVTLFTGLNFVQVRTNARALNGQMDRHLANAKEIGLEAATVSAEAHEKAIKTEVAKATKAAATEAVNQVMRAAMAEERAKKARGR